MPFKTRKQVKKYREGNITAAFSADLMLQGVTAIPNLLLRFYKNMGITDSQIMLIIQVLRLRTEDKNLYPTPDILADYLSGSTAQVERDLNELLEKEILAVTKYYDEVQDLVCDGFDFEPLFERISEAWACAKVREIEKTRQLLEHTPQEPVATDFSALYRTFEREFARPLSPMEVDQIRMWCGETEHNLVLEALRRAVMLGKHNFKYIDSILLEWKKNNLRTVEEIAQYDHNFQQRRMGKDSQQVRVKRGENMKKAMIKSLYLS